jgi:D-glycero-D-manno-heptose 1,7-bisphosphate phosphatase
VLTSSFTSQQHRGFLLAAAAEWNLSLPGSYMIGDRWRDVDCGHGAGCKTIYIGCCCSEQLNEEPAFTVSSMLSASSLISSLEEGKTSSC